MFTLFMFVVLTFAGWMLLIAGLRSGSKMTRQEEDERTLTTGEIILAEEAGNAGNGKKRKSLQIQYRVNGQIYTRKLNTNVPPDMIGKTVDVYYNSDQPTAFHIEGLAGKKKNGSLTRIGLIWIIVGTIIWAGMASTERNDINIPLLKMRLHRFLSQIEWEKESTPPPTPEPTAEPTVEPYVPPKVECQYHLNDEGAAVLEKISVKRGHRYVIIPEEVDGHPVVGLEADVFSDVFFLNGLELPGTIPVLEKDPFHGIAVFVKSITIGSGTEEIADSAFARLKILKKVTIPASVTKIADDAFYEGCKAIFYVVEGSEAERYCREKGYSYVLTD